MIGTLDDYPTRSGYLITPMVVWGGRHPPLRLNPAEVASIRRIRLVDIAREDAIEFDTIPESKRRVVRLNINGRFIHAPTAALIYQFREVLGRTRHARRRPGAAGVRLAVGMIPKSISPTRSGMEAGFSEKIMLQTEKLHRSRAR